MTQSKISSVALLALLAFAWASAGTATQTLPADACALAAGTGAEGPAEAQAAIGLDPLAGAVAVSTCTAPCGDGIHTVSCTATTCQAYSNYVRCNGQTYTCPGCYAYCQNNPDLGSCYSASGQCSAGLDTSTYTYWISCSGQRQDCPSCPGGTPWC